MILPFKLDNKPILSFKQEDKTTSLKQDKKSIFHFLRLCLLNFFFIQTSYRKKLEEKKSKTKITIRMKKDNSDKNSILVIFMLV
jgi:hypothetical protein